MTRIRIVAGELGGRRIEVPPGRRTRPTREKVREAWFSALGPGIAGSRVADLFAGSGALGLEALSRGATSVTFVESDLRVVEVLERNVRTLGVEGRTRILRRDVDRVLRGWEEGDGFDLVLADPPYDSDWPRRLARALRRGRFARLLCVEHRPGALEDVAEVTWSREYGDSALSFLRPRPAEDDAGGDASRSAERADQREGGA